MDLIEESEEGRASLLHHVKSLGSSLRNAVFVIIAGGALGYIYSGEVLSWLTRPYSSVMGVNETLNIFSPFEKIWVHLKLALWAGTFVVLPGIYLSVYSFFKPALHKFERKSLNWFACLFYLVSSLGIYLGHKFVIPLLLEALVNFKGDDEKAFISLAAYVSMSIGVLLATAFLLELPVVMFELSFLGWVNSKHWSEGRRVAIVVNAAVSAFLSPPDVISMLVLMVPIQLLYECGILCSRMAEWRRHAIQKNKN